jgi:Pyruvate/2-oxoacid:ferredoxin oxidoreductase delta subunit
LEQLLKLILLSHKIIFNLKMIESKEHRDDLIQIAKKLIRKPHSIPTDENNEPTETYIEYLSLIYNPEIAKIVQQLPVFPEGIQIAKFANDLGLDKNELIKKLSELSRKRFIVTRGKMYSLPDAFMMYDVPFIVKENYEGPDAKKFADLSRKFFIDDKYYKKWETSWKGTPYMRVLTVSEQIDPEHEILPLEQVYSIIDKNSSFAVISCPCRLRAGISGVRECTDKYPLNNCLQIGPAAEILGEDPGKKKISKQEAKELMRRSAEVGLVLTTDNTARFTTVICSCCECCCGMLRGLTKFDNPRAIAKANFISTIDEELCTACETCLGRCKFNAITVNNFATVNPDKCIGCGLCAVTCPSDAITMKRFEREVIPGLD